MIVLDGDPPMALVAPDLTPTQCRWLCAVAWLQEHGPVTFRKLSEYLGVENFSAQGAIARLERKGYVTMFRRPKKRTMKGSKAGTIRLSRPLLWRELAS